MGTEEQYDRAKARLLRDTTICAANRGIFRRFFEHEEYKLRRQNGLAQLDSHCCRTLLSYCSRLRTVNRWFKNKPWARLTRADIQRVYDGVEDGRIRSKFGKPFIDRRTYYGKIMLGRPFKLAGKRELAAAVMEYHPRNERRDVRYIDEAAFRTLVNITIRPEHRLLLWLCFDIGENVSSILALRRSDCTRQRNPDSNEPEYRINLRRETLKRSRRARSEITNYAETVEYLDAILASPTDREQLFNFGHRQAAKILARAARLTETRSLPGGHAVSLKDLRSSMACDLLRKGWTTDEVNARLGHTPSSRELDRYINFLAIDRHRPKKKVEEFQLKRLLDEIEQLRQRERLASQRHEQLQATVSDLRSQLDENNRRVFQGVRRLLAASATTPVDAA